MQDVQAPAQTSRDRGRCNGAAILSIDDNAVIYAAFARGPLVAMGARKRANQHITFLSLGERMPHPRGRRCQQGRGGARPRGDRVR